jgi:hypothetical protein
MYLLVSFNESVQSLPDTTIPHCCTGKKSTILLGCPFLGCVFLEGYVGTVNNNHNAITFSARYLLWLGLVLFS